jgi:glyoxylase-like metal-dependent hydrolase (beta-lactamase superfamily II)
MPKVFLLKPGSITRDGSGRILDARSSVTLIISGSRRIIVDTGLSGEEETILCALAELGLEPEDIDVIINTHSHPDHCGNNHLFSRAEVLTPGEGEEIASRVKVMETPGHTMDSISLTATCMHGNETMRIVVAGDALPTLGNFQKSVPPALHVDRDLAISSMERIIRAADVVVPGHDFPFFVKTGVYVAFHRGELQSIL